MCGDEMATLENNKRLRLVTNPVVLDLKAISGLLHSVGMRRRSADQLARAPANL